jgi:phage tail-like protein
MPVFGAGAAAAALGRATGLRDDPYQGYGFLVEIQGIIAGGFTEVSGLDIHTEVEEIRQGGDNSRSYKLPRTSSYANLQLIKGVVDIDMMWPWYQDVVAGRIQRRNGTLYLLNQLSVPVMWWNFFRAYPVAWAGPRFDASTSTVLSSQITLAHEGIENPVTAALSSAVGKVLP